MQGTNSIHRVLSASGQPIWAPWKIIIWLGPKLSKDTIFFHFDVLRPPQKRTCCPDTKMPHQNSLLSSISFFLIRVKAVSICAPSEIIIFKHFRWGSNFIESPSSLVHMFQTARPPTCYSYAQDASPEFKLHSVLSASNQHCVDLSPMQNYNFRWGPNFLIESPFCLVHMFQTF